MGVSIAVVITAVAIGIGAGSVFIGLLQGAAGPGGQPPIGLLLLMYVFMIPLGLWLMIGIIQFFLRAARTHHGEYKELFGGASLIVPVFVANFLSGLISLLIVLVPMLIVAMAIGLLVVLAGSRPAVVVTGTVLAYAVYFVSIIYVSLAFSAVIPLVIDRRLGAVEAIKTSWRLTNGNKLPLFGLWFVCMLLYFGGALLCGIGLIFTLPFMAHIFIAAYLAMSGAYDEQV
ncbi:MAG TPA: hypothetical protein VHZ24_20875 [Pirellulales bacterium]|nr:hypothetical protein [Pirellulales bacterium]